MSTYDIIIIGAGINGCALAHTLKNTPHTNKSIVVLEQEGIAAGGSGAAGAFINPKVSKAGALMEVINHAYAFAMEYYPHHFKEHCTLAPLVHLAKYPDEDEKVAYFRDHSPLPTQAIPHEIASLLTQTSVESEGVYLNGNAILEAQAVCEQMLEGIEFKKHKVESLVQKEGLWHTGDVCARQVVICTGAYAQIIPDPSITLRSVYGQRCEISCHNPLDVSLHQHLSISAKKKNGHVALGATHALDEKALLSEEEAFEHMLSMAELTYPLEAAKCVKVYQGMRSGSNDYMPIVGPVVDVEGSLLLDESAIKGNKGAKIKYHEGLYMINGVGGYGFVLAPYLATMLTDHLLQQKALPEPLLPERFYFRYAKKREQGT